jgi:2-hydroxychromene-2-carboxylate isomerase
MDRIVDYYFVSQSPWTYLGHMGFADVLARNQATARVKPVDIGRVFSASGGLPLAQRPKQRQSYRLLELARYSKRLGLPLNLHPKFFPVAGDRASRYVIAAAALAGDDAAMTLAFALQRAVWAEERDIADAATIAAIVSACGLDHRAVGEAAGSPATQSRYEANTQEAIDAEVFGAPTYIPRFGAAKDERFWGQDRIELLADALGA